MRLSAAVRHGAARNPTALGASALLLLVLATSCYQPYDFGIDHRADRVIVDPSSGDWLDAATGAVVFDGQPGDRLVPAD